MTIEHLRQLHDAYTTIDNEAGVVNVKYHQTINDALPHLLDIAALATATAHTATKTLPTEPGDWTIVETFTFESLLKALARLETT